MSMNKINDQVTCSFVQGRRGILPLLGELDTLILPQSPTSVSAFPGIGISQIGSGSLLFIPAATCNAVSFHESYSAVVLSIDPGLRRRIALATPSPARNLPASAQILNRRSAVVAMLQVVRHLAAIGEIENSACLASIAQLLLHETLIAWEETPPGDRTRVKALDPQIVARIDRYIEQNMEEHVDLGFMARLAGMSRYHFLRTFKEATGFSPLQYVIAKRVDRAQQLLSKSSEPIAEVAYAVGFSSQSHFTSAFKRQLGTTPGAFRRRWHPRSSAQEMNSADLAQRA